MPQINLLSVGGKKKVISAHPSLVFSVDFSEIIPSLLIRSGICLGLTVILWTILGAGISKNVATLNGLEEKVKVLGANPKEIEKIKSERVILEKKISLIDSLSSRKFFWFEKFEILAGLVPNGIWLTEVSTSEDRISAEKIAAIKNKVQNANKEKVALVVKGVAVADEIQNAVGLIGDFIKGLQANWKFSKDFTEIKLNNATKETIGGIDVMKFDFICESRDAYAGEK